MKQIYILLGKMIIFKRKIVNSIIKRYQKASFASCGDDVYIGSDCRFTLKNIHVMNKVYIGDYCSFISSISKIYIGSNVMFGPHVTIRGGNHKIDVVGKYMIDIKEDEKSPDNDQDVLIQDDVWIGTNVTILKGVTIGKGSVVGAGSIVAKDIPPYTIHLGNHKILQKVRFTEEQIIEHERKIKENESR